MNKLDDGADYREIQTYLKEGETILDCIRRNRADVSSVLELLATEKRRTEDLQSKLDRYERTLTNPTEPQDVRDWLVAKAGTADQLDRDAFASAALALDRGRKQRTELESRLDQREKQLLETQHQLIARNAEIAQLRELLNVYNLGGWTDSERLIKERDEARSRLQAQSKLIDESVLPWLEDIRTWALTYRRENGTFKDDAGTPFTAAHTAICVIKTRLVETRYPPDHDPLDAHGDCMCAVCRPVVERLNTSTGENNG